MRSHHLFIACVAAIAMFSGTGCAVGISDDSGEEEDIASDEQALGPSCGYLECVDEGDPYYPRGDGEPSCNECSYISWKRGYYQVCANGPGFPVSYHECTP